MSSRNPDPNTKPNVSAWFAANPAAKTHCDLALSTMLRHFAGSHGYIDKSKIVEYRFGSSYASFGAARAIVSRRHTRVIFWLDKKNRLLNTIEGERKGLKSAKGENLHAIEFKIVTASSVQELKSFLRSNSLPGWSRLPIRIQAELTPEDDEANYPEGSVSYRWHRSLERNPKLVSEAKKKWLSSPPGHLACSVCSFEFTKKYGKHGIDYIEAHHRVPVAILSGNNKPTTKISDLSPVCSNCHRMLHRGPKLLSIEQLKKVVAKNNGT